VTTVPAQHERRAAQRFDYSLPVAIHIEGQTLHGCTQNISGRGILLLCDRNLAEGAALELTLSMPADITLTAAMRVRCRGHVLRATPAVQGAQFAIAVCLEKYEYLSAEESASTHDYDRISGLHGRREPESPRTSSRPA
jgi:hypothetical protein